NASLRGDISETLLYLRNQKYYTKYYNISQKSTEKKIKCTEGLFL
ncbi:14626_t:CDS:1, partial [Dentiscutata heterogama]